jgi:hypothetical protein
MNKFIILFLLILFFISYLIITIKNKSKEPFLISNYENIVVNINKLLNDNDIKNRINLSIFNDLE